MTLPTDPKARKAIPLVTGCLDYFPDALAAVAALSVQGNVQHGVPGAQCRWDRSKSGDEADALARHLRDRGTLDTDGIRHSTKVAWRALALLQKEIEHDEGLPVSRGSFFSDPKTVPAGPLWINLCDNQTLGRADLQISAGSGFRDSRLNILFPVPEADGDTHMPPMQEMIDETGKAWGAATPLLKPLSLCHWCGVDLNERPHDISCLSSEANRRI